MIGIISIIHVLVGVFKIVVIAENFRYTSVICNEFRILLGHVLVVFGVSDFIEFKLDCVVSIFQLGVFLVRVSITIKKECVDFLFRCALEEEFTEHGIIPRLRKRIELCNQVGIIGLHIVVALFKLVISMITVVERHRDRVLTLRLKDKITIFLVECLRRSVCFRKLPFFRKSVKVGIIVLCLIKNCNKLVMFRFENILVIVTKRELEGFGILAVAFGKFEMVTTLSRTTDNSGRLYNFTHFVTECGDFLHDLYLGATGTLILDSTLRCTSGRRAGIVLHIVAQLRKNFLAFLTTTAFKLLVAVFCAGRRLAFIGYEFMYVTLSAACKAGYRH